MCKMGLDLQIITRGKQVVSNFLSRWYGEKKNETEKKNGKYLGKGGDILLEKEGYKCNLGKEEWKSKAFT